MDDNISPPTKGTLADHVHKVRSKNAGPFWITIDIFCGDRERYHNVLTWLDLNAIASRLHVDREAIERFDIESLHVIKLSFPRPVVQGDLSDRDMHGAQWALLLAEMPFAI